MVILRSLTQILTSFTAFLIVSIGVSLADQSIDFVRLKDGTRINYVLVLPDNYDPAQTYPTIIAFAGGGQSMKSTRGTVDANYRTPAEERGYIVIAPPALNGNNGRWYGDRAGNKVAGFLEAMANRYPVRDGKFHLMGLSNGGISSFHAAYKAPDRVLSITAFPGYVWQANDERYALLSDICVRMYAGENDTNWVRLQERDRAALNALGHGAYSEIFDGEGHVPASVSGKNAYRLFDALEAGVGC